MSSLDRVESDAPTPGTARRLFERWAALWRLYVGRNAGTKRAEAEAALAVLEARKAHARLREAIDILPQGIVFLDAEGRYILWNQQYARIYSRSADLFKPGVKLADTLRIGIQR